MKIQRIFGIILICLIAEQSESKALNSDINLLKEDQRVKRGYGSYGGNEHDSTIHVSSGVLQYAQAESPSIHEDPWKSSGLSPGYEVWLQPTNNYHPSSSSPDIHASISSSHPASDFITNTVFSKSSDLSGHNTLPSTQLHTHIISSSDISDSVHGIAADHSISTISDNIDFNNVSDIKSKHYAKSYGK